jgi:hypothetical protein
VIFKLFLKIDVYFLHNTDSKYKIISIIIIHNQLVLVRLQLAAIEAPCGKTGGMEVKIKLSLLGLVLY